MKNGIELWCLRLGLENDQVLDVCGNEEILRQAYDEINEKSFDGKKLEVHGVWDTYDRTAMSVLVDHEKIVYAMLYQRD